MTVLLRILVLITGFLLGAGALALTPKQPEAVRIDHFDLRLEPSFETQRFAGTLKVRLTVLQAEPRDWWLDAGALTITSVRVGTSALVFDRIGSRLRVQLPTGSLAGEEVLATLEYSGAGSGGLRFDPENRQVATAFSTSQWMPCSDDPSVRATFTLTLVLPEELVAIGNGRNDEPGPVVNGKRQHRWHLQQAMPSYLYGFAAGPFRVVTGMAGLTPLLWAGPSHFSDDDLRRIFAESADMLAFYERRSGVPYALPRYAQVLLYGPAAQEMAGFSVMGARYGTRVLADPKAIWLGAHEMAHQWWGNGLTNRAWTHFWLNEGIASFMTAAYIEHRFGRAAYLELMELTRTKYLAIRGAGQDKSLMFPDWEHPTAADRSLVYDKGALVMHELRSLLGEEVFWLALQHYTRKHWGQSVETADFRRAMEESSKVNLDAFFRQWVD